MSYRWPFLHTPMPAAREGDSWIAASKALTFGCLGNDFEVICWFKATANLSCEIIRRHQALAQPSICTMRPQLKVSVSLAEHFQAGNGDQHFHGPHGLSCKEYQLTLEIVFLSGTDAREEWWYWSVEKGERNVYFNEACSCKLNSFGFWTVGGQNNQSEEVTLGWFFQYFLPYRD